MEKTRLTFVIILLFIPNIFALPEQGIWAVTYDKMNPIHAFPKSMYKGTKISVSVECTDEDADKVLQIEYVLRYSPCAEEYIGVEGNTEEKKAYVSRPDLQLYPDLKYTKMEYKRHMAIEKCSGTPIGLEPMEKLMEVDAVTLSPQIPANKSDEASAAKTEESKKSETKDKAKSRKKRADKSDKNDPTNKETQADPKNKSKLEESKNPSKPSDVKKTTPTAEDEESSSTTTPVSSSTFNYSYISTENYFVDHLQKVDPQVIAKTWKDGYYVFILQITASDDSDFTADVKVRMEGRYGFISAVDWPLLIFYGVMGLVYIIYGVIWLVLLACNWRDLLRVQYWVGGVIVLGMLEKAVFYAEYQSITNTGVSVHRGAEIFAEVVSCLKRALARMLVIIVSLGFGIVKPRLGPTFHKVLFVGGLYFILAVVEGSMRKLKPKGDQSTDVMLAAVPLAVVDASICWWIFSGLLQTTRTLRLRRNIVKLTLYRHFTNTLIFAVLASIIFMIWAIVQHKMKTCLTDWKELWVDDAFWHLLFSVILLVIMVLWRPTTNNQRYAFSPLLDSAEDEEEDETIMHDAFEGMKMRGKNQSNGSPRQKDSRNSIEDDLKWVEENIPTSITDKALPSLMDSDEEIMTAKYEMSKMQ